MTLSLFFMFFMPFNIILIYCHSPIKVNRHKFDCLHFRLSIVCSMILSLFFMFFYLYSAISTSVRGAQPLAYPHIQGMLCRGASWVASTACNDYCLYHHSLGSYLLSQLACLETTKAQIIDALIYNLFTFCLLICVLI